MKLEIGPGKNRLGTDWVGIGPNDSPAVDMLGSWGEEELPFTDNSFGVIYASHVIEHIWWFKVPFALREAYRCLKENGRLEIWTVDFETVVKGFLEKRCMDQYRHFNPNGNYMRWVNGKLFSYSPPETYAHHSCFDRSYLTRLLREAGFQETFKLKTPRGEDHGSNLGIGGIK